MDMKPSRLTEEQIIGILREQETGASAAVQSDQWAADDSIEIQERQDRFSKFIRHFAEFPLEALKALGESLSAAHGLAAMNPGKTQAAAMNKVSLDRFLWREGTRA
jgi:hypothetical protein